MVAKRKMKKTTSTKIKASAKDYINTLIELKKQVQEAQIKAVLSANKELIKLYWAIGKIITEKQEKGSWGSSIIERLAQDLQAAFPGIAGFSKRNVFRMQAFYRAYEKVPQSVAQIEDPAIFSIPWGHNAVLLDKIKDSQERLWYAQKAIEHGWSRTILEMQIKSDLHGRKGKAITNFAKTLPAPHSDLAHQSLKDPYVFDFLTLHDDHVEHDLEQGLIDNVQKMLLELGKGFAFVARQHHLQVGSKDFYLDLLFYHFKLQCFVVVELKAREFDPRDAGQINFYLSTVDNQLKQPTDKPTIGLLLCKSKDSLVAEYALQNINKPIGVASYETELVEKLPKSLKSSLPTIEEIEAELEKQGALSEVVVDTSKKRRKK